ncbi:MAG: hypothetical protein HKN82_16075 [Akkermansiaceae bacterium]|nr:hypothetical protein [Akkermansiaceae bacterium]
MKITTFTLIPALVLSLGTGAMAADDEETPLAEAMEDLSASLKKLRRARDFNAKAELIRGGEDACIKSLQYLPATIEAMPDGADKTKAVADYRRLMGLTLALMSELELAFLAEDEAKAEELVDKLKDLKKEGHEKYEEE